MNIQSVGNSPVFGKTPVMSCIVQKKDNNENRLATLYKMDPHHPDDLNEMLETAYNYQFYPLARDFENSCNELNPAHDFYLLKTDCENEPVSGIETSLHYFTDFQNEKRNGVNTVIDEIAVNKGFKNPILPTAAQVALDAANHDSKNIVTAFRCDEADLSKESFSKSKYNNWILPKKRFDTLLIIAAKKAYIEPIE